VLGEREQKTENRKQRAKAKKNWNELNSESNDAYHLTIKTNIKEKIS
jgi:hypothetical protein